MTDDQKTDAPDSEAPKIIVDDDWKQQAQADKEKLAEQAKSDKTPPTNPEARPADQQAPGQQAPDQQGPEGQERQLPPASFTTLVSSVATQAMMALGGFRDPDSDKVMVDLDLAKHHIDMLSIIEEKTKGNLTDQEKKLLDSALYEIRMQYVQIAQHATMG